MSSSPIQDTATFTVPRLPIARYKAQAGYLKIDTKPASTSIFHTMLIPVILVIATAAIMGALHRVFTHDTATASSTRDAVLFGAIVGLVIALIVGVLGHHHRLQFNRDLTVYRNHAIDVLQTLRHHPNYDQILLKSTHSTQSSAYTPLSNDAIVLQLTAMAVGDRLRPHSTRIQHRWYVQSSPQVEPQPINVVVIRVEGQKHLVILDPDTPSFDGV